MIGLDHVSVTTGDIERSIRFYRDVLGLPLSGRGESADPELSAIAGMPGVRVRWAELELGRGQILELVQYLSPEGVPLAQRSWDPGSTHIALGVDDIDGLHQRLVEVGVAVRSEPVELHEEGDWNGVRCLYLADPDGVTIELVERPRVRPPVVIPELDLTTAEPSD